VIKNNVGLLKLASGLPNLDQKMPNEAFHRTAIPLCSIAAGELCR